MTRASYYKEWKKNNKEYMRAYYRAYRKAHREEIRERNLKYKDKKAAADKLWRKIIQKSEKQHANGGSTKTQTTITEN